VPSRCLSFFITLGALWAMPTWAAITFTTPANGSLAVCFPGNTQDLSSDGCYCTANVECIGVCPVGTGAATNHCEGVTTASVCGPAGNTKDFSADGCPCTTNLECQGVCPVSPQNGDITTKCIGFSGGGTPASPVPGVCLPGNALKISADGCPCTSSSECNNSSCSSATDTCGGLVGKVFDTQPTITAAVAAPIILINTNTSQTAKLSNAVRPSGQVRTRLFSPNTNACSFFVFPEYSKTFNISSNGTFFSGTYAPSTLGEYQWIASYTGNAYNLSTATSCFSMDQQVTVIDDNIFSNDFE